MRVLTEDFIAALEADSRQLVMFYEGAFDGSPEEYLRLWTGLGSIDWDSKTWLGAGALGRVSPIVEAGDVRATGIVCALDGIPSDVLALALESARQGKPGRLWIGALNADRSVIADPAKAFEGRLDVPEIEDTGATGTILISYESRLRDLERAREFRYTDESQQIFYAGDRGFEYVPGLQEWNGVWGKA